MTGHDFSKIVPLVNVLVGYDDDHKSSYADRSVFRKTGIDPRLGRSTGLMILIVENEKTYIQGSDLFILNWLDKELRYTVVDPEHLAGERDPLIEASAWDGWVRLLRRPKIKLPWFPTGLLSLVERLIKKYQYEYTIDDRRVRPKEGFPELVEIPLRDYQRKAVDCALKAGRGVLDMVPRCHAQGEPILMADGTTKPVEDVQVGDRLIGPDSTVRRVLELHSGEDLLYEIIPRFGGEPFTVNQHHELVLICGKWKMRGGIKRLVFSEQVISVCEYLITPPYLARMSHLKLKGVEFPEAKGSVLSIDPYSFGLTLSKGNSIPKCYLLSTSDCRLQLLAGVIDNGGYLFKNDIYGLIIKNEKLVKDFLFLVGSLGFRVKANLEVFNDIRCYRIHLCGDVARIPTKISKEAVKKGSSSGNAQLTSFKVRPKGRGKFYGFTVDGDNRYVSAGFIELKNSGKTRIMCEIQRSIALPTIWVVPTDGIARQTKTVFDSFFYDLYSYHLVGAAQDKLEIAKKIPVVISTMATAVTLPDDFYQSRQCIMVDEFHHAAAKAYSTIFEKCAHIYFRYGATGTFMRSAGDEMAMHAHLRETIYRITSADLLQYGYLVPTKVVFLPITQRMPRSERGPMPTSFFVGHGKYGIHEFQYRNDIVAQSTYWLTQYGYKVLVLVGTKKQGRLLQSSITKYLQPNKGTEFKVAEFISTDMRRQVQARIIKAFIDSQEIRVLLGTTILGEGIDLPTVDALVYARGEKAEVSLTQSIYRTCTAVEGKTHAVVVDFADRHNRKLLKHSQERLEVYYKEPIFEVDILEDVGQFNHWLAQVSFSQTRCAGEPK